jgi:predicted P-loop ATPase
VVALKNRARVGNPAQLEEDTNRLGPDTKLESTICSVCTMATNQNPNDDQEFLQKLTALKYILSRVRSDLHARRSWNNKKQKNEYYKRPKDGAPPQLITDAMLHRHITAPDGTNDAHLGVYPLLPGADTILCAVLDFDDHGGAMQWGEFIALVKPVIDAARAVGLNPWCVRSGGGHGLHAWFSWDLEDPQNTADVRALLTTIIEECGFSEGAGGGVQGGKIEIFPKSLYATIQEPGNLIALPFARASTWLDKELQPTNKPTQQITSHPVPKQATNIVSLDEYRAEREGAEASFQGGNTLETAKAALAHIPPDCGYDLRQKLGMALKAAFGDEAFEPWLEWIKQCGNDSYKGEREHRYHWNSFRERKNGKKVTLGSLYWHAEENGWVRPKKEVKAKLPPLAAAVALLDGKDEWQRVFAFDTFANRIILLKPFPTARDSVDTYPRELTDADIICITIWIQNQYIKISSGVTYEALTEIAQRAAFHPVREYLRGLQWDGVKRCDTWLIEHFGAEDTPFNRAVGARWLIAAVARVMKPGCLVKNVPVLEGPQDMGKSSALRIMAVRDEWFTDHMSDPGKKDALEESQGKWIVEFAELANMQRTESERIKSYLSTPIDRFRPSYARKASDFPRQWVGAATINPGASGYLKDETGAVRFWPVQCANGWKTFQTVDTDKLRSVRDQLWAEATARYNAREKWWLHEDMLRAAQTEEAEAREQEDPREPMLRKYLKLRPYAQTADILLHLGYELDRPDLKRLQTEIGAMMCRLKWVRWRAKHDISGPNGAGYYYFPPGTTNPVTYAQLLVNNQLAVTMQLAGQQKNEAKHLRPDPGGEGDDPPF